MKKTLYMLLFIVIGNALAQDSVELLKIAVEKEITQQKIMNELLGLLDNAWDSLDVYRDDNFTQKLPDDEKQEALGAICAFRLVQFYLKDRMTSRLRIKTEYVQIFKEEDMGEGGADSGSTTMADATRDSDGIPSSFLLSIGYIRYSDLVPFLQNHLVKQPPPEEDGPPLFDYIETDSFRYVLRRVNHTTKPATELPKLLRYILTTKRKFDMDANGQIIPDLTSTM